MHAAAAAQGQATVQPVNQGMTDNTCRVPSEFLPMLLHIMRMSDCAVVHAAAVARGLGPVRPEPNVHLFFAVLIAWSLIMMHMSDCAVVHAAAAAQAPVHLDAGQHLLACPKHDRS